MSHVSAYFQLFNIQIFQMTASSEKKAWPMLLDMTKEECKKALRSLGKYCKIFILFSICVYFIFP